MMMMQLILMVALCGTVHSSRFTRILWQETRLKTWVEAQGQCRSEGAELATLLSPADLEQMDLRDFFAWFGLKKDNGNWMWIDGKNKVDTDSDQSKVFIEGQPDSNENCGMVRFNRNRAYGEHCSHPHFVFCEIHNNGTWNYTFYPEAKYWSEGKTFCRNRDLTYMDFIFEGEFDRSDLPIYEERDFPLWIGLKHDGKSWSWSDGALSDYRNWTSGSEPSGGSGLCAAVSSKTRLMSAYSCSEAFPFLCYKQNYSVFLEKEALSWDNALEHCEGLSSTTAGSFRLLRVEENELESILSYTTGATTSKVWVGLRFLAGSWFWSDGAPVALPSFSLSCPGLTLGCGALVLTSGSNPVIQPTDCNEKLNLLCYKKL